VTPLSTTFAAVMLTHEYVECVLRYDYVRGGPVSPIKRPRKAPGDFNENTPNSERARGDRVSDEHKANPEQDLFLLQEQDERKD